MSTTEFSLCLLILGCCSSWIFHEVNARRSTLRNFSAGRSTLRNFGAGRSALRNFGAGRSTLRNFGASRMQHLNCECGVLNRARRIVNGKPAQVNEYPWLVSIRLYKDIHCSGTIINDLYILTAGHCLYDFHISDIDIVLAAHDLSGQLKNSSTPVLQPEKFILHQAFRREDIHDYQDIALIKLKGPIKYNWRISPVCLPAAGTDPTGQDAEIAGWGRTGDMMDPSYILLKAEVHTITRKECFRISTYTKKLLAEDSFCAVGKVAGTDSCSGDSGGPIMALVRGSNRKMNQIGVISWGIGCAEADHPGVYVDVAQYVKWISDNTRDAAYCIR